MNLQKYLNKSQAAENIPNTYGKKRILNTDKMYIYQQFVTQTNNESNRIIVKI